MFPKLKESGYDLGNATSLIVSAAPLGLLIPPSSIQIIYAWSANQSVLTCFLATIGPGVMLICLLCLVNYFLYCKQEKQAAQNSPTPQTAIQAAQKIEAKESKLKMIWHAMPALFMPVIILGGIYGGIMTPTEAAAVSVVYAIPIGFFVYKGLNLKKFKEALVDTGTTTGVLMVMFLIVMILSRLFVMEELPEKVIDFFFTISRDPKAILIMMNLFMILIGMLMDDVSGCLLCTPLLLPLVNEIGMSPIQFAAVLGVNLGMGNITPPTAPLLYLGGRVTKVGINRLLKPSIIMLLFAWLPTLIATTYFPQLSLAIPSFILGKTF
jgi:tripartite ATP-independent transporter DctM subunit